MEKLLHLYKYVDGKNDTPFPSKEQQAILFEFKYDAKRMGNAPTITGTLMHPLCLDELWGDGMVYVTYNSERYFLKQTPTSSYSNEDTRYKHEVDFVSERIALSNVYFYDVVTGDTTNDKPVSNSSNVTFYGDIHEFAQRLNYSLQYAKLGYSVVVDSGIASETMLVTFQDQFIANVLQEVYNTYKIPYYFVGKVIHIGYTNSIIETPFKYGVNNALLSVSKDNVTQKIINRITGIGSSDNIPYYYPNLDPKGVSEVLLNSASSDKISISNTNRYKKVKLCDKFTYISKGDETLEYIDKSKYIVSDGPYQTSENYENVKTFELVLDFPFDVDIYRDTTIVLDYSKGNLSNFKARLYRNVELWSTFSSFGSTPFYRLYEGSYNFSISLEFTFNEWDEKQEITLDDIPNIVDALEVSIYANVEGENKWVLNDLNKSVELNDYGLAFNGTPTNGDTISFKQISYITPQPNLMPPIYRESMGNERFYNATNNTYIDPISDEYYTFDNPFVEGKRKEHKENFEDIKPSIKGVVNAAGLRIDMFSEFAYDANDNDEFDEEGNYIHPYFFAKLRKFDGNFGFNLFEHAIEEDEMVISMTSGSCGACNFIIGVDNETQKNIVQVDENGKLKRDADGNVMYGMPQDRQNDTSKYEVWIALKKDIETFGVVMPNASNNYKPSTSDTFVILHIDLPQAYVYAAENSLKEEIINFMANNNSEKFTFSINFSRIFFALNPTVFAQLNENSFIKVQYNNIVYSLFVSSYSYSINESNPLPEIRVDLAQGLDVKRESITKQLENAAKSLNSEVQKVSADIAATNMAITKKTQGATESITILNSRIDNIEKVLKNVQIQGGGGSGEGGITQVTAQMIEEALGYVPYSSKNPSGYITSAALADYAKKSDIPSLAGYATEQWVKQQGYLTQHQDLSAYAKSEDVANTYATKVALQTLQNEHNALSTKVTNLDNLLNSDVSGVINTWGEVVDFLNEYSGSEDLATILAGMNNDIANRVLYTDFEKLEDSVSGIAGYFTNGSANNALKLGGQLPSYYATVDALNLVKNDITAVSNRVKTFEDVIGIDSNGDVYIKGTRNFYTAGGTIGMAGLGSGGSGGGGAAGIVTVRVNGYDYNSVNGIVTLPDYPSLAGYATESWVGNNYLPKSGGVIDGSLQIGTDANTSYNYLKLVRNGTYMEINCNEYGGYINYNSSALRLQSGTITYEGNTLLHSGNYTDYALSKNGGTIGNGASSYPLIINAPQGGFIKLNVDATQYCAIGADDGLGTWITEKGGNYINIRGGNLFLNNANTFLHSGNYSSYALPLSGGTITGLLTIKASGYPFIEFKSGNTTRGYYGFSGAGVAAIWDTVDWQTLIHSGNIGSYNAGSADFISKTFVNESINYSTGDSKVRLIRGTDANWEANGFPIRYVGGLSAISSGYGWQMVTYGDTNNPNPYFRSVGDNSSWGAWRQLAFLTDNVASATKLQTARTIWGRSFDGTANIDTTTYGMMRWLYFSNSNGVEQGYVGRGAETNDIYLSAYGENSLHFQTNYSTRATITPNGNVLIGTTYDNGNKFQIYDSSSHNNAILISTTNGDGEASIFYQALNSGSYWAAGIACGLANQNVWSIYSSNAGKWIFAAKTTGVDVNGNLTVTGDITSEGTMAMAKLASSSDRKLKNNIAEVSAEQSMGVIRQLRPTTWNWKKDGKKSYGFIAQEVEPIVPEMVVNMEHLHLEYNQLHAFEIGAIQYIDSEVDKLKKDLAIANGRIEVLKNELKQYRRNA